MAPRYLALPRRILPYAVRCLSDSYRRIRISSGKIGSSTGFTTYPTLMSLTRARARKASHALPLFVLWRIFGRSDRRARYVGNACLALRRQVVLPILLLDQRWEKVGKGRILRNSPNDPASSGGSGGAHAAGPFSARTICGQLWRLGSLAGPSFCWPDNPETPDNFWPEGPETPDSTTPPRAIGGGPSTGSTASTYFSDASVSDIEQENEILHRPVCKAATVAGDGSTKRRKFHRRRVRCRRLCCGRKGPGA